MFNNPIYQYDRFISLIISIFVLWHLGLSYTCIQYIYLSYQLYIWHCILNATPLQIIYFQHRQVIRQYCQVVIFYTEWHWNVKWKVSEILKAYTFIFPGWADLGLMYCQTPIRSHIWGFQFNCSIRVDINLHWKVMFKKE